MGSGASAARQSRASQKKDEGTATGVDGEEDEEDHSTETRSLPWRRAWRALLDYKWTEDDDEYEIHPEADAKEKVTQCIEHNGYEARSSPGFISGRCLLHLAAEQGAEMCCIALLEAGAQPDVRDKYEDTPLHCAAKEGRVVIINLLIEFGSDPLLKNKHNKTPLQWAEDFGQISVIKPLKDAGGDPPVEYFLPPSVSDELADDLMLSVKQVSSYHEAFQLFDEDGSGELDTEELGNVIRSIGFQVSESEVVDMVEESDEDRSGALDFIEFLELMARRFGSLMHELNKEEQEKGKQVLKHALNEFDSDNSGTLSYNEYMNAMMHYGEPLSDSQAQEILTNLDIDDVEEMDIDYDKLADILSTK